MDDFVTADWKERGGISAGGGAISLMNQAPHPNAAKLLINWFLSAKGQLTLQKIAHEGEHYNSGAPAESTFER